MIRNHDENYYDESRTRHIAKVSNRVHYGEDEQPAQAKVMAATQGPVNQSILAEKSGPVYFIA